MIKPTDDRGSLPLAMLLTIVAVALSGLLAATLNLQLRNTRYAVQRSDALDAAAAGIQVALGQVRSAGGDPAKLPCGPFSGAVSGATRQAYTVTLFYLTKQPPAGDTVWANANDLPCTGTYLTGSTALFVMLSATGTVATGKPARTLTATYTIHSASRDNLAGGLIHVWSPVQPPNPDLCLSAPSVDVSVGDVVTVEICDNSSYRQKFTFTPDDKLMLVASLLDTAKSAMCLEAASSNGQAVRFKACANGVPQNFLYNDSQNLEGLTGTGPSGTCFNVTSPGVPGSTLVMWKVTGGKGGGQTSSGGCGSPATTTRTFLPDALVGLGGTLPSGQLSSFALSNQCVSDDNGIVDMKTCQYVMGGTLITWDMLWTLPDPALDGPITATNTSNKKLCLVSPGTASAGSYVTVVQCPNTISASMMWHRSTSTGLYATSYRIESRYGVASTSPSLCLAPVDPSATPPDPYLASGVTRLVMVTCTGANLQKWNAPAAVLVDTLYDVTET